MGFNGLRILSLESRRAEEMATLIRKQGGDPFAAPSMREIPLEEHEEAWGFGEGLLRQAFDCVLLLTGVGTRLLWKTLRTRYSEGDLKSAFMRTTLVVRGPKPAAALREIGLAHHYLVPEPNTWHEVLETMRPLSGQRVALQEYGKSNPDLIAGLRAQGRTVTTVRIYGWGLPEDTGPLREAARRLANREIDVILLTTATQADNLLQVATEDGIAAEVLDGMRRAFIASIGPTTSEGLETWGLKADFEPSHPKMGLLVNEAAALAPYNK